MFIANLTLGDSALNESLKIG